MPLYTFYCFRCDCNTERIVPIKDRDEQRCGNCNMYLRRNIDSPGWVWKPTAMGGS